jgi:DnaJ family protein A protein 5
MRESAHHEGHDHPNVGNRREQEKAERAERARAYQVAAWAEQEQDADSADGEEEMHPEDDPLYCLACDKSFKSEGAFKSHER